MRLYPEVQMVSQKLMQVPCAPAAAPAWQDLPATLHLQVWLIWLAYYERSTWPLPAINIGYLFISSGSFQSTNGVQLAPASKTIRADSLLLTAALQTSDLAAEHMFSTPWLALQE